jgi:hypothetical protein
VLDDGPARAGEVDVDVGAVVDADLAGDDDEDRVARGRDVDGAGGAGGAAAAVAAADDDKGRAHGAQREGGEGRARRVEHAAVEVLGRAGGGGRGQDNVRAGVGRERDERGGREAWPVDGGGGRPDLGVVVDGRGGCGAGGSSNRRRRRCRCGRRRADRLPRVRRWSRRLDCSSTRTRTRARARLKLEPRARGRLCRRLLELVVQAGEGLSAGAGAGSARLATRHNSTRGGG